MSTSRAGTARVSDTKDFWASINLPEGFGAIILEPDALHERFTDEEYEQFCAENPELRVELTSEGEMIVQLPVVSEGGGRNFLLTARFGAWVEADGTGVGFDSSAGFTLPNGAKRAPDVSWMRRERWAALTPKQQETFAHLCPDFVVELRSQSDRLKPLQKKMEEYLESGAQLGWLIDPLKKQIHIYRPDTPVEVLDQPTEVSGEQLLPGFVLKLEGILD
jgi:Uma2 family endonuclease